MNKNIEKYMYITIELLVIVGFLLFSYFNFDKSTEFLCPIMQKVYTTKLVYLLAFIFILAQVGGFALSAFLKAKVSALCDAYQKRNENISIEKDSDKAKIAALEAKIATLETALDAALRNK